MLPIQRQPAASAADRETPQGAAGAVEHGDVRARVRAARRRLAASSTKAFVLPGYDTTNPELGGGELIVIYRRLLYEELTAVLPPLVPPGSDIVAMNAQFLIDACEDIRFRDENGDVHHLIDGHSTTYTINLDTGQSLATYLEVEQHDSARDQLVAIFGENELALNDHSGDVHKWMTTANAADAETALGEP